MSDTEMENIRFFIPAILMFLYVVFTGAVLMIFFYIFRRCQRPKNDFEPFYIDHEINKKLDDRFNRKDFIIEVQTSTGTSSCTLDQPTLIEIRKI